MRLSFASLLLSCLLLVIVQPAAEAQSRRRWVPATPKKEQKPAPTRKVIYKKKTVGLAGALAGKKASDALQVDYVIDTQPLVISKDEYKHYGKSLSDNLAGRVLTAEEKSALSVAEKFYRGLSTQNHSLISETMDDQSEFSDEAYPHLVGSDALDMWGMICNGDIKKLTYKIHYVEGHTVYGSWVADYVVFGRPIHNVIKSKIIVKDGKIASHRDDYDFMLWAKQALPQFIYLPIRLFGTGATTHVLRSVTRLALWNYQRSKK